MNLLVPTDRGLHCPVGGFFIDPTRPVERAVVTHAHSDHATPGCRRYLTSESGEPLVRLRVGETARIETLAYGQPLTLNGVRLSLHPSGHLLGAAQVRLEYRGEVWVVTGDYKRQDDPSCLPFEPLRCHTFVTETTFGLPIYQWPEASREIEAIHTWWQENRQQGITSVISVYSLGKAQRILASLDPNIGPLVVHESIEAFNRLYREAGIPLPPTTDRGMLSRSIETDPPLVLTIGSAIATPWMRRFGACRIAGASGWLRTKNGLRNRGLDRGFVLSDHVDWPDLLESIQQTQAERVWLMHGFTDVVARHLEAQGLETRIVDARPSPLASRVLALDDSNSSESAAPETAASTKLATDGPISLSIERLARGVGLLGKFATWADQTGDPLRDTSRLHALLEQAEEREGSAILSLLLGTRPPRVTSTEALSEIVCRQQALPDWLWQRCVAMAGDVSETIATVLDDSASQVTGSVATTLEGLRLAASLSSSEQEAAWRTLSAHCDRATRWCLARWWTGTWRSPVSRTVVLEALARRFHQPLEVIADRTNQASLDSLWARCAMPCTPEEIESLPVSFVETHDSRESQFPPSTDLPVLSPSSSEDWLLDWWWPGLRVQVIRSADTVILRTDARTRLEGRLPELRQALTLLPIGTVIEGVITPWRHGRPLSDRRLEARLARRRCTAKDAQETPLRLFVFDLLREASFSWIDRPLIERRQRLSELVASLDLQEPPAMVLIESQQATGASLELLLDQAKQAGAQGLIAKRQSESRNSGPDTIPSTWYRYRVSCESLLAVLLHHRSASPNEPAEWTLGLHDGDRWIPVARVPGGWSISEEQELEQWVGDHAIAKHGPVRTVSPIQVLEVHYDRREESRRHACGFLLRGARIAAWRPQLSPAQTPTLSDWDSVSRISRSSSPTNLL